MFIDQFDREEFENASLARRHPEAYKAKMEAQERDRLEDGPIEIVINFFVKLFLKLFSKKTK